MVDDRSLLVVLKSLAFTSRDDEEQGGLKGTGEGCTVLRLGRGKGGRVVAASHTSVTGDRRVQEGDGVITLTGVGDTGIGIREIYVFQSLKQ